jgi:hypothetical protein
MEPSRGKNPVTPGPCQRRFTARTYLPLAGAILAGAGLISAGLAPLSPEATAANLFSSTPIDASRFAVLARPVGNSDWNLLVLEQIQPRPLCWEERRDGLIDPALNRFNFTGICSRYLDSNGYSLRIGEQDLATRYRLQVRQNGAELQLEASTPSDPTVLVVGRARVPLRERDGFVALKLEPGWDLQRRVFNNQTLSHLYFANSSPLPELLAKANAAARNPVNPRFPGLRPPVAPPSLPALPRLGSDNNLIAQGPIRLPVIPFSE